MMNTTTGSNGTNVTTMTNSNSPFYFSTSSVSNFHFEKINVTLGCGTCYYNPSYPVRSIFVPLSFAHQHHLLNKTWVTLSTEDDDIHMKACLVVLSNTEDITVSPSVAITLGTFCYQASYCISISRTVNPIGSISLYRPIMQYNDFRTAKSVTITPYYTTNVSSEDLLSSLQDFFQDCRYMASGDLFPLTIKSSQKSVSTSLPDAVSIPAKYCLENEPIEVDLSSSNTTSTNPSVVVVLYMIVTQIVDNDESSAPSDSVFKISQKDGTTTVLNKHHNHSSGSVRPLPASAVIKNTRSTSWSDEFKQVQDIFESLFNLYYKCSNKVILESDVASPITVCIASEDHVASRSSVETIARTFGFDSSVISYSYGTLMSRYRKNHNSFDEWLLPQESSAAAVVLYLYGNFGFTFKDHHHKILQKLRAACHDFGKAREFPIVLVYSINTTYEEVPTIIASAASYNITVANKPLSLEEKLSFFKSLSCFSSEIDLESLCRTLNVKSVVDLKEFVADAMVLATLRDDDASPVIILPSDIEQVSKKSLMSSSTVPNVKWSDIGGLDHIKKEILNVVELPLLHPTLFKSGLHQRSGILLFGPPGTGKTLVAKAIATECNLNFVSIKGPELLNMYIGESEKNIRKIFEKGRNNAPAILFFDELDSLAPARGRGISDAGGVMDRVVSSLLAEIDNAAGSGVFMIAATNRPDLIEPALLRPGRIDRLLYLGPSSTEADQLKILQALTRKFELKTEFLQDIVKDCPMTFTGADFYALCSQALSFAIEEKVAMVDEIVEGDDDTTVADVMEEMTEEECKPIVTINHFRKSLNVTVPSVTPSEFKHYESLKEKYNSF